MSAITRQGLGRDGYIVAQLVQVSGGWCLCGGGGRGDCLVLVVLDVVICVCVGMFVS